LSSPLVRYGYERGLKQKTTGKDGVITIHFPKALVLYWETTKMRDTILMGPIEKVEVRKSLEIARNMLTLGISPEKAAQATKLPLAKVKALLKTTKVQQIA
jgi:hypothetical protein